MLIALQVHNRSFLCGKYMFYNTDANKYIRVYTDVSYIR